MHLEVFNTKAAEMGDFYVYFTDVATKTEKFAVATADLSTPYIQARKHKKPKAILGEVVLWNWTSNNFIKLPVSVIKKLVPLATVLKNDKSN